MKNQDPSDRTIRNSILFFFISSALVFSGCKKIYYSKIEGRWEKVKIENMSNPVTEFWEFGKAQSDGIGNVTAYVLNSAQNGVSLDTMSSGSYSIVAKPFKTYLNLDNFISSSGINGRWEISRINKNELIISFRETGGMFTIEFCRTSCN